MYILRGFDTIIHTQFDVDSERERIDSKAAIMQDSKLALLLLIRKEGESRETTKLQLLLSSGPMSTGD